MKKIEKEGLDAIQSIRQCPLCCNGYSYRLINLKFALFDDTPISNRMHLVSCYTCGFIYYDTPSTESEFNYFYKEHYLIYAYYSIMENYKADRDYNKTIGCFINKHLIDENSRIVDVGCGQGRLLRSLRNDGYKNLAGVELCEKYVQELKKDEFDVYCGSAVDLPIEKESADLLIYKHIFEHFYNPHQAVKSSYEHLKFGGYVLVEVPNASLFNSFENFSFLHYFVLEHINHFDLFHIRELFKQHGFELKDVKYSMLDIAEDYPVPIMSCLFYKPFVKTIIPKMGKDFGLAESIVKWMHESADLDTPELKNLCLSQRKTYVWGLSYRTAMYLEMSSLKNCNIIGYIDIDTRKQRKKLNGKKIYSPEILSKLKDDVTVVVGVGPSSRSMARQLTRQGFKGEIIRLL